MASEKEKHNKFGVMALLVQVIFVVLFFVYVDYDDQAKSLIISMESNSDGDLSEKPQRSSMVLDIISARLSVFQDTVFLVVAAFGFCFCYLARHCLSSLFGSMFVTAVGVQWAILCRGFIMTTDYNPIRIDLLGILGGLSSVSVVLITWGCIVGKVNPVQLLVLTICELPLSIATEWLAQRIFQTTDVGGSMLHHEFGAFFGVAVSLVISRKDFFDHPKGGPDRTGAFRCLIGTMIFWVFWPSAVAAGVPIGSGHRQRVLINVYVAMLSSCLTTLAMSSLMDPDGKFDLRHAQNATVAGGVAVGTCADSVIGPGGAMLLGVIGATITTVGISYVQPFIANRLRIHDTVGVLSLHGLVGMTGGFAGAIASGVSTEELYGYGLYLIYPAMIPTDNSSTDYRRIQDVVGPHSVPGLGRTPGEQAGYQVATLVVCCFVPFIGGTLTGLVLRAPFWNGPITTKQLFEDNEYWRIPYPWGHGGIDNDAVHECINNGEDEFGSSVRSLSRESDNPPMNAKGNGKGNSRVTPQ